MSRGCFITLEGIEGAGKSTALTFLTDRLSELGITWVLTREPGGTEIAEKIRQIILDHHQEKMDPDTELLLYFAGRAQHLHQLIIPALQQGKWVICDRFTDATYAYQGEGRQLVASRIAQLEQWVQQDLRPDYTLLFDVEVATGLARIQQRQQLDRIETENEEFFKRVRNCYLWRAQQEPQRFKLINAGVAITEVAQQLTIVLTSIVENWRESQSK